MASNSETGIEKNITNFETLVITCQGFGTDYKPSNKEIELPTITTQSNEAKAEQKTFLEKKETIAKQKTNVKQALLQLKSYPLVL